ncbi:hypothetical protein ES332_A07G243000v1 [Gossypium tomentosum]|uniref:Uncharacterized protein n=1 Tax=Gossypium tomentosum TaxID=34277 RepID=A0A5D2PWL5_GOSTO|nr:hypothetical protein ES332_A07G243000v1 [Gossypium tomentosum]
MKNTHRYQSIERPSFPQKSTFKISVSVKIKSSSDQPTITTFGLDFAISTPLAYSAFIVVNQSNHRERSFLNPVLGVFVLSSF